MGSWIGPLACPGSWMHVRSVPGARACSVCSPGTIQYVWRVAIWLVLFLGIAGASGLLCQARKVLALLVVSIRPWS